MTTCPEPVCRPSDVQRSLIGRDRADCGGETNSDAEYSLEGGDIYAYSVDDGTVKQLTTRKGPDSDPVPSPGGKKIAYIGHDWKFQSYTVNHLYVMDSDGKNTKNLTASLDRDVRAPHWSWDGKTLYFLVDDHGNTQLYSADPDSGAVKELTKGVQQLSDFSLANNLMAATVRTTPTEPGDISHGPGV